MRIARDTRLFAPLAVLLLAACGGGGGSSGQAPAVPAAGLVSGSVSIVIPPRGKQSLRPAYISPSTQSVSISVNSGPAQTTNVGPTSPNCTSGSNGISCTIPVSAPPGNDTFAITLYDGQNGQGNMLASTSVTTAVTVGQAFTVTAAPAGVAKTLQLIVTPTSQLQSTISARILDAGGNAVNGPFATPVTIAVSGGGASGATLSSTTLASSTSTITGSIATALPSGTTITVTATSGSLTASAVVPQSSASLFPLPSASALPYAATTGSDGSVWFVELGPAAPLGTNIITGTANKIGRLTTTGIITEFPLPNPVSGMRSIAPGPDGALWFQEILNNKIGRITTGGTITEFPLPSTINSPRAIANGPDGALWFTANPRAFGRITTTGTVTTFSFKNLTNLASANPAIAAGPDGALWATNYQTSSIVRMTTSGVATSYMPITNGFPYFITAGTDGNIWIGDYGPYSGLQLQGINDTTQPGGTVYALAPNGLLGVQAPFYNFTDVPGGVVFGSDGNLWFSDASRGAIGRATPSGKLDLAVLSPLSTPEGVAFFSDGSLAVTDPGTNGVWRIAAQPGWSALPTTLSATTDASNPTFFAILETGNSAPFTVAVADATIAQVAPKSNSQKTYQVTGLKAGSTTIAVSDPNNRVQLIPVTVTTTNASILSTRRASYAPFAGGLE